MNNQPACIGTRANSSSRFRAALTLLTAVSVFYISPLQVRAAVGDLDSSFGVGGKVVTDVSGFTEESGEDVAIQPDGKILVAGFALNSTNGTDDFVVLRYNPDGSPDTTFGLGGQVFTDFGNSTDWALAIALQADGRIVVAGLASTSNLVRTFAVARYNINGDLDQSFGIAGKTTVIFTRNNKRSSTAIASMVWDIVIQSDGRIVLAGDTDLNFGLARLNPDGSLDPNFGVNGKTFASLGAGPGGSAAYAVAIQTVDSEERIVAAGYAGSRRGGNDFAVARFRSNGALDIALTETGKCSQISQVGTTL